MIRWDADSTTNTVHIFVLPVSSLFAQRHRLRVYTSVLQTTHIYTLAAAIGEKMSCPRDFVVAQLNLCYLHFTTDDICCHGNEI